MTEYVVVDRQDTIAPTQRESSSGRAMRAVRRGFKAVQEARRRSRSSYPTSEPGYCLREVRECYGIGSAAPDAATAWRNAKIKHATSNPRDIPQGVPVFWLGGANGHGHIAISARRRWYRPKCWSTDIRRSGYFDRVDITEIHDKWGLTLVGWTEDLNGVIVK